MTNGRVMVSGDVVVLVHVVGGVALLGAGAVAATTPKRRRSVHPVVGRVYVVLLVAVLGSGLVIGSRHPGWSPFEIATPPTLAMGLVGFAASRRPLRLWLGARWKRWHIVGMGGSLIGVVTATAFQVVPRLVGTSPLVLGMVWALPTVIGSTLIARAVARRVPAAAAQGDRALLR